MAKSQAKNTGSSAKQFNQNPVTTSGGNGAFSLKKVYILLAVIVVVLYANTLQNGYVMDDILVLRDNTLVTQGIKAIPRLLSTTHMFGYMNITNDLYRPLSLVMFAIEYQLFGPNPAVGHFFNIVVFIGCVLLLFRFLLLLLGEDKTAIAFIATLLFAVHPIHTEVVANIKSRDELLCFLFSFTTLVQYTKYVRTNNIIALLTGTFTLFLALLSKETAITFMGIVPLLFFFYINENKRRSLFVTLGCIIACGVFLVIRSVILNSFHADIVNVTQDFAINALYNAPSTSIRIATEIFVMGKYLYLLFIPYPLLCFYSFSSIPFYGFGNTWVLLTIAVYGFLFYLIIKGLAQKNKDLYAFGILFYLMTISLVSNFFFIIGSQMSERFLFLPSVGFCICIAVFAGRFIDGNLNSIGSIFKSKQLKFILIPVLVIFSGMTIARNKDWSSGNELFKADVTKSPDDCRLNHFYALSLIHDAKQEKDALVQKQYLNEAISYLNHAITIYPDFAEAHVQLGIIYDIFHQYDSAEKHDLRALEINRTNSFATNSLASVYYGQKKFPLAIQMYRKTLAISPDYKLARINLAHCFLENEQYDSSIFYFRQVLAAQPDVLLAQQCIAQSFFKLQHYDSAAFHFKQAAALNNGDPDEMTNAGVVYMTAQRYPEAIEQFLAILRMHPNYALGYSNLGMAYYNNKEYRNAIQALTQEMNMSPQDRSNAPTIAKAYRELGKTDSAKIFEAMSR